MADLLEALEEKREGYDEEAAMHRLYLDAYGGGGGFSGATVQPTSDFWGAGSTIYNDLGEQDRESVGRQTYLDRFQREQLDKFIRRIFSSHYSNYIKPLTDLKLSYILRKEFPVDNRPDKLDIWRKNIDGRGTDWEQLKQVIYLRAATLGWVPVLIDMPPAPTNVDGSPVLLTQAASDEAGLQPTPIPLFPANLTDYDTDDTGAFTWAKVRTDHEERESPFHPKYAVTRYTVWFPDRFSVYEVREATGDTGKRTASIVEEDTPHRFGRVPIEVLRHIPSPDDPVKGIAMHGQETVEARAHFNRQSELNEHLRSQVFAILVLAAEENEENGQVTIGTENGLYLDPASSQKHYYMSPEAGVAETYETRLESGIEEIYRQARVEFARPTASRQAVSGIARKFEFAQTDRALSDFAKQIALFEHGIDELTGMALGVPNEKLQDIQIAPPSTFDIDDIASDIDIAVAAITDLKVGPTAARILRSRIIGSLIPGVSDDDEEEIEQDLLDIEVAQEQERAAIMAQLEAGGDEEDEEDKEEEEDDDKKKKPFTPAED